MSDLGTIVTQCPRCEQELRVGMAFTGERVSGGNLHATVKADTAAFEAHIGLCGKLAAVEALIDHARRISPSERAVVYVADLERALGMDAPRMHKTGGNE